MSFEENPLFKQLTALGEFKDLRPASVTHTASGSSFWRGTLIESNTDCFIKYYPAAMTEDVMYEAKCASEFEAKILEMSATHIGAIVPIKKYTLPDGSIVVVTVFHDGVTLFDLCLAKQPLDLATSKIIRDGLMECAQVLHRTNIAHRDVLHKNFMVADEKLYLFDFQTAIKKENPKVYNPSLADIRGYGGLGYGFSPKRGTWNDVHSVARTYEEIAPLMATTTAKEDIASLYELAKQGPTLENDYIVDATWKQKIWKDYIKLWLRPAWTCKPTSREKRRYVLDTIRKILKNNKQKWK